jgi:hypothetical protein
MRMVGVVLTKYRHKVGWAILDDAGKVVGRAEDKSMRFATSMMYEVPLRNWRFR